MARIFIGNLPFDTELGELENMLKEFEVAKIDMPKDRATSKFRGFAFAEVKEDDRAIQNLDGGEFGGRTLKVNKAEARPPRSFTPATQKQPAE